jgi:DNA polymerase I
MKILDCTYTHNWEGEPIIHLYGVGGKHITRSGHRPYFYAEFNNNINNEVAARLLHSRGIHDFVKVEKFRPIGYQSNPTTMYQIFTISPRDIRQLREEVSRIPNIFKIYEADIPYKNRWLIDNGLGGFADIDCGEDAPISYCSFDIECLVPPEGTMPTSDKDPIILISMAFSPQFEGNDRVVLSTKPTNYQGCPVILCKDEHHLITTFLSLFNTYNPDIIAGYNTNQFDFPYLQGRCKVLGISPKCTRDNREWYIRNRFDGGVDVTITGRVVVDLLPIIRANYSLNRYNLATAASLVNYEKLDVSPKEMRNAYLGDYSESWDKVIAYSDRDAELVMKLLLDLKLVDKYIAISTVSGTLLQDVVNLGQTKLIDNLIIREFRKHGRVMNMRPKIEDEDEDDGEVGYTGGSVLEPETGLHEHIITMDYTSLFPSIMRAYNICPTTIIKDEQCDEKVVLGNNVEFSTKHVGIVPQILERLFNERVQYKTMMKTTKDTTLYNQYDNMQYALKILLNSVYGMFGFTRARLYDVDIASSVTYVARDTLLKTKAVIEENPNLRVIAGDTDSCMIKINNMECTYDVAKNIAMDIHDKMAKILPPPMNLDFEAYSDRGVFLKKKRYAMRLVGPDGKYKLKMRGIETRRRDFTAYTVETLEQVINILLSTGDKKQAATYANTQVARIKNLASINDDPELVKKLLLTKKFSRPIDGYKAMMPHIEAIKRAINRGEPAPSIGDRIAYYVIEGRSKKISDLTELESYAHDKGLGINKKYYLEKQLIPPINRIFEAIHYNWIKEESNSKQKTLFDL